jgi:hypothetical protein
MCLGEPDKDTQLVLDLLKLELPEQPSPKVYYPQTKTTNDVGPTFFLK